MSELSILFPKPVTVVVDSREVRIFPVKLRHFELYGKAAGALIEMFGSASIQHVTQYGAKHSRELRSILLATTSLSRWELWRLPAAVLVQLLVEVVRVNSSFFGEALPAMVRALNGAQLSND
ncbi:hypothetical protein CXF92_18520 [Pseudomonas sp. Choline-3u-10]|uniref:Uncharacterized protein n=1 Tax=viral metagenome TaxID=1070528 RepID=A0A6H1ZJZ5_9ZZZZ|nr:MULTISPECIES: hypothetical protein [Pseudomonadaceae]MBK3797541.1 hypothetical protein [Stutzerimonas stutzeri]MBK3876380.1 hypothetical protein [Stutzerimonas stutzeri]PKG90913.1 hypothetical protein CXF92_18520 [Pseudomonas sp. Choline-3u-10]